jgi:F-box/leucine-rich repeat protein 10/11
MVHTIQIFYFIRPTPANLDAYERWSGTDIQNHAWLGDMVDEVFKIVLTEGNTMIIPTGWIHAVVGLLTVVSTSLTHIFSPV